MVGSADGGVADAALTHASTSLPEFSMVTGMLYRYVLVYTLKAHLQIIHSMLTSIIASLFDLAEAQSCQR